jgi:radical SAM superfamily enzyme YgiQ (UPF0313 family)
MSQEKESRSEKEKEENRTICLVGVMSVFRGTESAVDPPYGLLLVGGVLKSKGYDVKIYHTHPKDVMHTVKEIEKQNPILVGFSTMTSSGLAQTIQISKHIKEKGFTTIWGGVHPSLLPRETLAEDYVDFVVVGEGEITIAEFIDQFTTDQNYENIQGLGYKKHGKVIINERRPLINNLDAYSPDWSLIDINKYIHPEPLWGCKRVISLQTSRGCPFRCTFCYNRSFNKSIWKAQSAEHVIKHINWLKEVHDVDGLIINDDNFFVNKERALEILEKTNIPVWAECPIKFIDEAFVARLAKTKLRSIFLGIESGSPESLHKMSKLISLDDTVNALKILAKHPKITVNGTMIIGIPGETEEDIKKTIDFAIKISKVHPNLVLNIGTYVPYPGTEMYLETIKHGFTPPKDTFGWAKFDINENSKMRLPWLSWSNKNTRTQFYVIDKCAMHLNRTEYGNWWQKIAKKVLHATSYMRMKYKFFKMPIEINVFTWYYSRYLRKKISQKSLT